jgi:hypothetical protein
MSVLLETLLEIQHYAESMPSGGIGKNGPTQEELDDALEEGRPIEMDACFHNGQQIWLLAEKAINFLEGE